MDKDENASITPFIDLVKNQKPHEFGDAVTTELGSRARTSINDVKEEDYGETNLGEPE